LLKISLKKSNPEPTTHKHRQSRIYSLTHTGEGIHHIIITKEQISQGRTARRHNLKNSLLTVQVRTYDAASVSHEELLAQRSAEPASECS